MRSYKIIFFDLDETLYTASTGLWEAISNRIYTYMLDVLDIAPDQIHPLRQQYLDQYGTTLAGLMENGDVDPADYLHYVHDVPLGAHIDPDPRLNRLLESLPQQKAVFTNASAEHAQRVLSQLGVTSHFSKIIGVEALDFINKPDPEAYFKALTLLENADPTTCIMVEDRAVNLRTAADLGMRTVLVDDGHSYPWVDDVIPSIHDFFSLPGLTPDQVE